MTRKIEKIEIYFDDTTRVDVWRHQLEQIEQLLDAISLLERARSTYLDLKDVFEKESRKK